MIIKGKTIEMPLPKMVFRKTKEDVFNNLLFSGVSKIQSKIIANRKIPNNVEPIEILNSEKSLNDLDIYKLKDIEKSAERISEAIINREVIGLLCDFDVDGISSNAVLYSAFTDFFHCDSTLIKVYISNRMVAGYGFSDEVVDRIINESDIATLLITADQGSKDNPRIKRYKDFLKKKKIKGDVIVTDHHHVEGKGPEDAFAVVNPQREDCEFKDKTICGCTVALLVMMATRDKLIEKGYLKNDSRSISELLTYSTAATIADCVSMASPLNRAIVNHGLDSMNQGLKPAWKATRQFLQDPSEKINVETIGFGLGPRINACSRTGGNGLVALKFYLSETDDECSRYLSQLDYQNDERKKEEKEMLIDAFIQASYYYKKGCKTLVIYLDDGNHGIHGIVASRIKERYGMPTIMVSPKVWEEVDDVDAIKKENERLANSKVKRKSSKKIKKKKIVEIVSGSARSIEGINLEFCLKDVEKNNEDLFLGWGGHPMAAGASLKFENIDKLREEFEKTFIKIYGEDYDVTPIINIDGELSQKAKIDFNFIKEINAVQPYGNNFEYPVFKIKTIIQSLDIKGGNKDTGIFEIVFGGYVYKAVWFKYDQTPVFGKLKEGDHCEMAVEIREQTYKGYKNICFYIKHANKI